MAQEHQEYIQTKVNPTLENLVTQVLLERPENPVPFMIRWFAEQTKAQPSALDSGEAEKIRSEISALQAEIKELEDKLGGAPPSGGGDGAAAKPKDDDEDEESEEEDDDDDEGEDLPPPTAYLNRGARASVSAEAYGDWNTRKAYQPVEHAKTDEQKERIREVISRSFLFNSLEKEDMSIIVGAMVEKVAPAGERIINEGEEGEVMFVIEKGGIDCLKVINGAEIVVKKCEPGDFFGELALLYGCPRAASVQAREDAVLWQLDRATFNHIVRDGSIKKREQYEAFLKNVPLLEKLGSYERLQLADSLRKESVEPGTAVITQGAQGDRFYLVEEGELAAEKNGEEVMKYKMGDYFGELALLRSDEARAASVVARTPCRLLWIDRRTFTQLLGGLEEQMKSQANQYA